MPIISLETYKAAIRSAKAALPVLIAKGNGYDAYLLTKKIERYEGLTK